MCVYSQGQSVNMAQLHKPSRNNDTSNHFFSIEVSRLENLLNTDAVGLAAGGSKSMEYVRFIIKEMVAFW